MKQDILAIDIALLLPDAIAKIAYELNQRIRREPHKGFSFDQTHLPHISLSMTYIEKGDIHKLHQDISNLVEPMHSLLLQITGIEDPISEWHASALAIESSPEIQELHEQLMGLVKDYRVEGGSASAFYSESGEPIHDIYVNGVLHYKENDAFLKFSPHISLGLGKTETHLSFPIDFTASTLVCSHLGNYCTVRKVLQAWTLKG